VPETSDVVLTVPAMDGQYHVRTYPGVIDAWPDTADGLLVGEENWIAVLCGTQFGPVSLRIQRYDSRPSEVAVGWEMGVEWSLEAPDGVLSVHDIYSNNEPTLVTVPSGWLRIRVSVRGRLRAAETPEPVTVAIEEHLLEIWPAADGEDTAVVSGPDEYAALLLG